VQPPHAICVYKYRKRETVARDQSFMKEPGSGMNSQPDPLSKFFGVVIRGQTYLNLLYLFLSFPLGLFYFILLLVGFSLGFGLSVLGIGLLILAGMLAIWWGLIAFERQLAIGLLRVRISPMRRTDTGGTALWPRFKAFLANPVTWKGLVYLVAKLPIGIISFIALVTAITVTGGLIAAPFIYPYSEIDLGFMQVETLNQALIASVIGILAGFVSLNLLNGLAYLSGEFARVMLGVSPNTAPTAPTTPEPSRASLPAQPPAEVSQGPGLEADIRSEQG